jgi:hypothetical protein
VAVSLEVPLSHLTDVRAGRRHDRHPRAR